MRPRTTWPSSTSANGGSTATGVAVGERRPARTARSARARSSSSSISASPRPGSSSGSSSSCWPNRASTQAWNRVPNRADGDGLRGIGRASSRGERVRVVAQPGQRRRGQAGGQRHRHLVGPVDAAPPPAAARARRPTPATRGRLDHVEPVVGVVAVAGRAPRQRLLDQLGRPQPSLDLAGVRLHRPRQPGRQLVERVGLPLPGLSSHSSGSWPQRASESRRVCW